jgi:hypothetical protein
MNATYKLCMKCLSPYDIDKVKTALRELGFSVCHDGSFQNNTDPTLLVWKPIISNMENRNE